MNYLNYINADVFLLIISKLEIVGFNSLLELYPHIKNKYSVEAFKNFRYLNYKTYNILLSTYNY
jgi:hypothetical protein